MKYEVKKEGRLITITIDNECGLIAKLTNLGASIVSIYFDGKIMTLTPESLKDFMKPNAYYGKTVGPIPNRVKDGLIEINGTVYPLDKNEGNNTLHSGKYGLSNQFFKYNVIKEKKFVGVNFTLVKKNKADGLPGKITYNIAYMLQEGDNTLYLSMSAFSDTDTVMGLTNHAYFTMGEKKNDGLKLTIPAHKFVDTCKEDLLPIEEKIVLPCLDFQKAKRIDKHINDDFLQNHRSLGYDHCFLLDKGEIRLESDKYIMDITTDFEALQIYSDNYNDNIKMIDTDELTHRGLAMEPQDSLLDRKILKKGQFYTHKINYHFQKK